MKAAKKSIFRLTVGMKVTIALFISCVLLVGVAAFSEFGRNVKGSVEGQARRSLQSVGRQNVKMVDGLLGSKQLFLRTVGEEIARTGHTETSRILDVLANHRDTYGFYDMGVIRRDGSYVTVNGEQMNVGEYDFFKDSLKGESVITEGYLSEGGRVPVQVFTMPVQIDGRVELILTGVYRSRDFLDLTNISSYLGNGSSVVLDPDGGCAALWSGERAEEGVCDMASYLEENRPVVPEDVEGSESLFFSFEKDGVEYLGYVDSLATGSWYLLTFVQTDYMYTVSREINHNILYIILGLYSVIAVIAGLFVLLYNKFQSRMFQVVFRDRLTGEKNYQYYKQIFDSLPEEEKAGRYLVNFDIDKFKMINLIYGTKVGDDILRKVYRIFCQTLPEDVIYHYHADIFVAILKGRDKKEIEEKLELFCKVIEEKIENKELLEMNLSFGVCPLPQFDQISLVYNNALLAKNEIKGSFTEKYRFYDDNLDVQVEYRNMELAFKEALQKKEFKVWYQPKYDMRTRKIFGAEALVRWKREDGTIVSPGSFIPVFENTGQIVELDEYVLKTVCADINRARKEGLDMKPISVNLSKLHLVKLGIVEKIQAITKVYGITGQQISFEITESTSYSDKRIMDQMVASLHRMGFRVDMDDYGTGSSTLLSLCDTSFDTLKLDKSFIDAIGSEKMDIVIDSTISMAQNLNMHIIAEGVENEEQAGFLLKHKCYMAQGYHYSKPLEREKYMELLRKEDKKKHMGGGSRSASPTDSISLGERISGRSFQRKLSWMFPCFYENGPPPGFRADETQP